MKFPSKKDWWLTVIVWGAMLFSIIGGSRELLAGDLGTSEMLPFILFSVILPIFILWIWLTTFYVLDENNLIIKYGPFKKTVPLNMITSVKKTMNPLSSPALSLKRLEIAYGQYNIALISPKNRDEFMDILRKRCPQAQIK